MPELSGADSLVGTRSHPTTMGALVLMTGAPKNPIDYEANPKVLGCL